MKNTVEIEACGMRGLTILLQTSRGQREIEDFGRVPHATHPFGLETPDIPDGAFDRQILFVGSHGTDESVKSLAAHVRFWAGALESNKVTGLRVISTPYGGGSIGQHRVFFEIHVAAKVLISGETTDFSGGGNAARQNLEDLFALLATTYGVEIERVDLPRPVNMRILTDPKYP